MFTERAIAARRRRERGTGDETTPLKSDDAIKTADNNVMHGGDRYDSIFIYK
jgi:hypothetical protein